MKYNYEVYVLMGLNPDESENWQRVYPLSMSLTDSLYWANEPTASFTFDNRKNLVHPEILCAREICDAGKQIKVLRNPAVPNAPTDTANADYQIYRGIINGPKASMGGSSLSLDIETREYYRDLLINKQTGDDVIWNFVNADARDLIKACIGETFVYHELFASDENLDPTETSNLAAKNNVLMLTQSGSVFTHTGYATSVQLKNSDWNYMGEILDLKASMSGNSVQMTRNNGDYGPGKQYDNMPWFTNLDGDITGWTFSTNARVTTDVSNSGRKSLLFENPTTAQYSTGPVVKVESGCWYILGGFVRNNLIKGAVKLCVSEYSDPDGNTLLTDYIGTVTFPQNETDTEDHKNEFKEDYVAFQTKSTAKSVRIKAVIDSSAAGAGSCYFDDFYIYRSGIPGKSEMMFEVSRDDGYKYYHLPMGYDGAEWKGKMPSFEDNLVIAYANASADFSSIAGWVEMGGTTSVSGGYAEIVSPDGVTAAGYRCVIPKLPRDTEMKITVIAKYKDGTTGIASDGLHVDLYGAGYDSDEQELVALGPNDTTTTYTTYTKTFDDGRPPGTVYLRLFTYSTRPIDIDYVKLEYMEKYNCRLRYKATLVAQPFDNAYLTKATLTSTETIMNPSKGDQYLVADGAPEHLSDNTTDNPFWKQDGKVAAYGDNQTWTFTDRMTTDGASPQVTGIFLVCNTVSDTGVIAGTLEVPNNPNMQSAALTLDLGRISRFDALSNILKVTGQEAWIDGAGRLNVVNRRGTKVQRVFAVGTDIVQLNRELSRADMCNALTLIGSGTASKGYGLEGTINVEDPDSIAKFGRCEKTMMEKNIQDLGILAARAWTILQSTKVPAETINADVVDPAKTWNWDMGDVVTLVDKSLSIFGVDTKEADDMPVKVKRDSSSMSRSTCAPDTTDKLWEDPFLYNRGVYLPFDRTYNEMNWSFIMGALTANGKFNSNDAFSEGYLLAPNQELYDSRVVVLADKAYCAGVLSRFTDAFNFYLIKFCDNSGATSDNAGTMQSGGQGTIKIYKMCQGSHVIKKVPPVNPAINEEYLVDYGGANEWKGKDGKLAKWTDNGESASPRYSWTFQDTETLSDLFSKLAETTINWPSGTPVSIEVITHGGLGTYKYAVLGRRNDPPASPNTNDSYIIGTAPTGAWAGNANKVATWGGSSWGTPTTPTNGDLAYVQAEKNVYVYNSTTATWAANPTATLFEVWFNNVCVLAAVDAYNPFSHGCTGLWAYCDKKLSGTAIPSGATMSAYPPTTAPASAAQYVVDNGLTPSGAFIGKSDMLAVLHAYDYCVLSKARNAEPTGNQLHANDKYIIGPSPTGTNWAGKAGQVATYSGTAWSFVTLASANGKYAYVADESLIYSCNGSTWSSLGASTWTFTDITTTNNNHRYIVPENSSGSWFGHDFEVATMDKTTLDAPTVSVQGDGKAQTSGWTLAGVKASNTNNYKLYWTLTNSGTTRTVNVYNDLARAVLVASGAVTNDGKITLTQQNSSGISGSVYVKFIEDDTGGDNVIQITKPSWTFTTTLDANATNFNEFTIYDMRNNARYATAPSVLKNQPTFTRDSVSYKDNGNTQIASGLPRYEVVNLLTANQSSVETDTTGFTATAGHTPTKSSDYAKYGSTSLKITTTGNTWDNYTGIGAGDLGAIRMPVVAGQTYTLSAYVYVPMSMDITPSARAENNRDWKITVWTSPTAYNVSYSNPVTVKGAWERLVVSFTTPANMTDCFVRIYTTTRQEANTVMYVDGIQLEHGNKAGPWVLGSAPASLTIEDGTTNLATAMTVTANGSGGAFNTAAGSGAWTGWTQVNITQTNSAGGMQLYVPWVSIPNGATYTWSIDFAVIDSDGYTLTPRVDGSWGAGNCTQIPGTNRWTYTWTNTRGSAITDGIYFTTNAPANTLVTMTFYIRNYQVENKPYATSYIDLNTTRDDESAYALSSGVISGNAGTIEMVANFPANGKWATSGLSANPTLLWAGSALQNVAANQIYVDVVAPSGNLRLTVYDGDGAYKILTSNTPVNAGRHYIAFTWDSTGPRAIYVDGSAMVCSTSGTGSGVCGEIGRLCIGYNGYDGTRRFNSQLSELRISNKAKTNTDISMIYNSGAMNEMGVETYTTYLLPLKGSLTPSSHTPYASGNGMFVEEATTNLLSYETSSLETVASLPNYFTSASSYIAVSTTYAKNGKSSLQISSTSAGSDCYASTVQKIMLKPSISYAWSCWVYAPSTTYLNLALIVLREAESSYRQVGTTTYMDNSLTGFVSLAQGWHYIYGTGTTPSDYKAASQLIIRPARNADNTAYDTGVSLYYDCFQVEEGKTHPTSFIPGGMTRLGDKVVLPGRNVLAIDNGHVEFLMSLVDELNPGSVLFEWGGGDGIDADDNTYLADNMNIKYSVLSDNIGEYDALTVYMHKTDTVVRSATFNRDSTATLSTGKSVAIDAPRFEPTGLTIEEGSTNLIQGPAKASTSYCDGNMAAAWTEAEYFRISGVSNSTSDGKLAFMVSSTYTAGSDISTITVSFDNPTATFSRWVIGLYNSSGVEITSAWTGWTYNAAYHGYFKDTFTGITSTTLTGLPAGVRKVYFGAMGTTPTYDGKSVSIDHLMIEAKAYKTSFVDGERSAEMLTVPTTNVISASQGTIEMVVNINAIHRVAGTNHYFFGLRNADDTHNIIGFGTYLNGTLTQIICYDGAGNNSSATNTLPANGTHRFAVRWSSTEMSMWVDGVKQTNAITNPHLPETLPGIAYIGTWATGSYGWTDSQIGDVVISDRARTDAELQARGVLTPLGADSSTTYYLPLTSDLTDASNILSVTCPAPGRKLVKTGMYYVAAGWITNQTIGTDNKLKLLIYDYETCTYNERILSPFDSSLEPTALMTYKEAYLGGNGPSNSNIVVSNFRSSCLYRATIPGATALLSTDSYESSSTYGSVIPTYQSGNGHYDIYTTYYAPLMPDCKAYLVDNQLRVTKATTKIGGDSGEHVSLEFANRNTATSTKVDNLVSNISEAIGSEQAQAQPQPVSYVEDIDTEHPARTLLDIDGSKDVLDIVFSCWSAPFRSTSRSNKGESAHIHGADHTHPISHTHRIDHNHTTPSHDHTSGNHTHSITFTSGYNPLSHHHQFGVSNGGSGSPLYINGSTLNANQGYSVNVTTYDTGFVGSIITSNGGEGSTTFGGGGSTSGQSSNTSSESSSATSSASSSATTTGKGSEHQHDIEYGIFEYNKQYKDDGTVTGAATYASCRMYINQLPSVSATIESYQDDNYNEIKRYFTSTLGSGGHAYNKFGVQGDAATPFSVTGLSLKELYSSDNSRPLKPGPNYIYLVPIPDKSPSGYYTSVPEGFTLAKTTTGGRVGNQTVYTGNRMYYDQSGNALGNADPNIPIPTGLINPKGLVRVYMDVRVIYRSG